MAFHFENTELEGLVIVRPDIYSDERGFFMESFKTSDFKEHGIPAFVQGNHSGSSKGVLRGMHYQLEPYAQGKLVRCILGSILDVAVDIRKSSPTFGKHFSIELNSKSREMLYIPPGYAHGFYTLSGYAEVCYYVTSEYAPVYDRGINPFDPELGISWPGEGILSEKDRNLPNLRDAEVFI